MGKKKKKKMFATKVLKNLTIKKQILKEQKARWFQISLAKVKCQNKHTTQSNKQRFLGQCEYKFKEKVFNKINMYPMK